jgi:hypothetical protein
MTFTFTKTNLVLCEGGHDQSFVRAILAHVGRSADFQTANPSEIIGGKGGNSHWAAVMAAIVGTTGFETLNGLIVVADNDADPAANIRAVKKALRSAPKFTGPPARKITVPRSLMSKNRGNPIVAIVPIPGAGKKGTLENLCIQAADVSPKLIGCADQFLRCSGASSFIVTKRAKVKLRMLIAASHKKNPEITLSRMWDPRQGNPNLIPISHAVFKPIVDFFQNF